MSLAEYGLLAAIGIFILVFIWAVKTEITHQVEKRVGKFHDEVVTLKQYIDKRHEDYLSVVDRIQKKAETAEYIAHAARMAVAEPRRVILQVEETPRPPAVPPKGNGKKKMPAKNLLRRAGIKGQA